MLRWSDEYQKAEREMKEAAEALGLARKAMHLEEVKIADAEQMRVLMQQEVWNLEARLKNASMAFQDMIAQASDDTDVKHFTNAVLVREMEANKKAPADCDGSAHAGGGDEVH